MLLDTVVGLEIALPYSEHKKMTWIPGAERIS